MATASSQAGRGKLARGAVLSAAFAAPLLDPLQNYRAAFLDRALLINPNFAWGWSYSGWVKVWLGDPDRAIEHIARAMRLSPIDPRNFLMKQAMARAHFSADRHDEARAWAKDGFARAAGQPERVAHRCCELRACWACRLKFDPGREFPPSRTYWARPGTRNTLQCMKMLSERRAYLNDRTGCGTPADIHDAEGTRQSIALPKSTRSCDGPKEKCCVAMMGRSLGQVWVKKRRLLGALSVPPNRSARPR